MNCAEIRERFLTPYVDNEICGLAAWRVRRHLTDCPACAAEADAQKEMTARLRSTGASVTMPGHLRESAYHALTGSGGSAVSAGDGSIVAPPVRRARILAPLAIGGVAGVCAAAAWALFWFLPGMPGRPTAAFANVQRAMLSARTAYWKETRTRLSADGQVESVRHSENWVRLYPPAHAQRTLPATSEQRPSSDVTDVPYSVQYPERFEDYNPAEGTLTIEKLDRSSNDDFRMLLRNVILSPGQYGYGADVLKDSYWTSETAILDGMKTLRFTYAHPQSATLTQTMWTDPQTHRVIRAEVRFASSDRRGGSTLTVREGFRYNIDIPDSVFIIKAPPGTKVVDRSEHFPR